MPSARSGAAPIRRTSPRLADRLLARGSIAYYKLANESTRVDPPQALAWKQVSRTFKSTKLARLSTEIPGLLSFSAARNLHGIRHLARSIHESSAAVADIRENTARAPSSARHTVFSRISSLAMNLHEYSGLARTCNRWEEITMILTETIAITADEFEHGQAIYDRLGFVILRGLYPDALLKAMEVELEAAQQQLIAGELDEKYGSDLLDEPGAVIDGNPYRHYVINCTDLSPAAHTAAAHPAIKAMADRLFKGDSWVNDYSRFGVVFQDSRADTGSHYSRIGWHSDFQSAEESTSWPGFAFTIHIDATSPANGFLRVVPGSHKRDIDKDELGARRFNPIPGEIPVFAQRGDVILHDYKLWHGAARGTAEGASGRRRHVRGGYYAGEKPSKDYGIGKFYKNAAR